MSTTDTFTIDFPRAPRAVAATLQDSMPSRYGQTAQWLSMAAFTLAFFGWLNETWLLLFDNPIWLNHYTEYAIIFTFGVWRIVAERNRYTRLRLAVLVAIVTVAWWLIPWLAPFFEPYVGYVWTQPVFPSLHVPGTVSFFLILAAVFLFGRRVICGWSCPCVGIRETVGYAFRDRTLHGQWAWRLRHSKWFFFIYYVGVMIITQYPPNTWTVSFVGGFYLMVGLTYFGTFFIAPIVGNRFYCRYLCPYGATFGLLNHAGFYGIRMDRDKCNDCRRCEQVCDMGIPVWHQGKEHGRVTGIEDCMGCARCVITCPTDALEIRDVRNLFKPGLVQHGSHLLGTPAHVAAMPTRITPDCRAATERVRDWREAEPRFDLATAQAQAARCLDCTEPNCRGGCPLHNRIPEWLEALAHGKVEEAAALSHATSNLPEVCGRLCPQQRLCEGACNRGKDTGAVAIGALERFITDEAFAHGWKPGTATMPRNGKRIAVVGAGPAGLACADELNKAGCTVTVYDKQTQIGGLLTYGVPPFKMAKDVLVRRHRLLEDAGVRFELGVAVDEPLLHRLQQEHDALFLGIGAQAPRDTALDGRHTPGVYDAVSYLAALNAHHLGDAEDPPDLAGRRVLVLGGGDSAMDAARAAVRQGAASVTVAYRGVEQALRAAPREVEYAREEGVHFEFNHQPRAILGETRVSGVRFATDNGVMGHDELPCDVVILALGQQADAPAWLAHFGVATDARGLIVADAEGRTGHPKIYAGGDGSTGPDLAVTAIAAGRRAAAAMLHSFRRPAPRALTAFRRLLPVGTLSTLPATTTVQRTQPQV